MTRFKAVPAIDPKHGRGIHSALSARYARIREGRVATVFTNVFLTDRFRVFLFFRWARDELLE